MGTFKPEDAPTGDANPTAADAFLEAANRLREANPRQGSPPAACAVELAERQARVAGKPPTEGDVADAPETCSGARLGRNAA